MGPCRACVFVSGSISFRTLSSRLTRVVWHLAGFPSPWRLSDKRSLACRDRCCLSFHPSRSCVCFHLLAAVNAAAMKTGVQILLDPNFNSFVHISRSRGAGSHGSPVSNFLRQLRTVFHGGCTIYNPTSRARGSSGSASPPTLVVFRFFNTVAILTGVRRHLIVLLTCVSLDISS